MSPLSPEEKAIVHELRLNFKNSGLSKEEQLRIIQREIAIQRQEKNHPSPLTPKNPNSIGARIFGLIKGMFQQIMGKIFMRGQHDLESSSDMSEEMQKNLFFSDGDFELEEDADSDEDSNSQQTNREGKVDFE